MSSSLAVVFLAACSQAGVADVINVATGLDASNNLITTSGASDAHWTVDQPTGGTGPAQVTTASSVNWFGGWLADGPNSAWITRTASSVANGSDLYTWHTSFNLTGLNLSTVSLSGAWGIDDSGVLALNGTTIASLSGGAWASLTPFSVATGSPIFVQGVNTLTMTLTSNDNTFEAARLEGSVSGSISSPTAPEPSSLILAASGVVALFGVARRRRLLV